MNKLIPILSIILTVLVSCSTNDNKQEFKDSQNAFVASIESFSNANESGAQLMEEIENGHLADETKLINHIKKGISESEKVQDKYLDFIHPQLKSMYRENLVGGYKLAIENIDNRDIQKAYEIDLEIANRQQKFWEFMDKNQNQLNLKMKQIDKKTIPDRLKKIISANDNKKSYWRMFFRFLISNFISIFVFSFFLIAILLPLAPFALLAEKINEKLMTIISIPFMIIAGLGQLYFWILWSAYCVFTVQFFIDSPEVTHKWIYYVTGFFSVTGPIGWLSHKETQSAKSYDEVKNIQGGTVYYSLIAIVAFIVFSIWTNLLTFKYFSWVKDLFY